MPPPRAQQRYAALLLKAGVVDELQLRSALAHCEQWGSRLPRALAELNFADEDAISAVLAKALNAKVMQLGNVMKDNGALRALGVDFCDKHTVFPVSLKDRVLTLAVPDPSELETIDAAASRASARVLPVMASEAQILAAIDKHFRGKEQRPRRTSFAGVRSPSEVAESSFSPGALTGALSFTPEMPAAAPSFTADERRRLEAAYDNQLKVGSIVRTVQELLALKGLR